MSKELRVEKCRVFSVPGRKDATAELHRSGASSLRSYQVHAETDMTGRGLPTLSSALIDVKPLATQRD